jgi:hypothetical protein
MLKSKPIRHRPLLVTNTDQQVKHTLYILLPQIPSPLHIIHAPRIWPEAFDVFRFNEGVGFRVAEGGGQDGEEPGATLGVGPEPLRD